MIKLLYSFALVFSLIGINSVRAAPPAPESVLTSFSLKATLSRSVILPGEAVGVAVVFKNERKYLQTLFWNGPPSISAVYYRKKGSLYWTGYGALGVSFCPSPEMEKIAFKAGEEFIDFISVGVDSQSQLVFDEPGQYELKVVACGFESDIKVVRVLPGEDQDKQAFEFVKGNELSKYFDMENVATAFPIAIDNGPVIAEIQDKLNRLIEKFPKSRYASYARRALIYLSISSQLYRMMGAGELSEADRKTVIEVGAALDVLAKGQEPEIAVSTSYNAGVLRLLLGETEWAIRSFRLVEQRGVDPTIAKRITFFSGLVQKYSLASPPLEDDPRDMLDVVGKNLERDGFDLKSFATQYPALQKKYSAYATTLRKKLREQQITQKEYYQMLSEMLDVTVRSSRNLPDKAR